MGETRMGEVEGVSGHPGGSGGYSRGHRSTPSQESNTLSQVSCTTDISLVDELEDTEESLKEEEEGRTSKTKITREEDDNRATTSTVDQPVSRTVSPLERLKAYRSESTLSRGKSLALDLGEPGDEKVPLELGKTLLALIWLVSGFFATTLSLALTHDRVPDSPPLPDILLDSVQYQEWGLMGSELLLMLCVASAFVIVVAHTHRSVILRRIWLVLGLLYYFRAITMTITVLPRPDPNYLCQPKTSENLTVITVLQRVGTIVSGGGLSMNGRHVFCGDYIFSGHTMTLVLAHLVTVRYSPPSWRPLHWLSLVAAATGVALLLLSRGHYSIDVLLAYYVTTRLWHLYHAVACNKTMREEGEHNPLTGFFWWPVVRFITISSNILNLTFLHHNHFSFNSIHIMITI